MDVDGWCADPFGVHEERLFDGGRPTPLVRDGGIGSYHLPHGPGPSAAGALSPVDTGNATVSTGEIPFADFASTAPTRVTGPPTKAVRLNPRPSPRSSRRPSPRSRSGFLIVVLATLGLLASAVAVLYSTVPAHSLPSLLGRRPGVTTYRTGRAEVAATVAIVLLLLPIVLTVRTRFPELVRSALRKLLGR